MPAVGQVGLEILLDEAVFFRLTPRHLGFALRGLAGIDRGEFLHGQIISAFSGFALEVASFCITDTSR